MSAELDGRIFGLSSRTLGGENGSGFQGINVVQHTMNNILDARPSGGREEGYIRVSSVKQLGK